MRFQALSLTTPSANVAGAAPATPPDYCFPCNVRYDYSGGGGGGTIIDPITPPAPTGATWTVGTLGGENFPDVATALANASVVNGDRLLLSAQTFTVSSAITVQKQVTIQGASRASTILQTAATAGDPVVMLTVQTSNFVIRDCTVKHKKTTNTSVETAISVIGFSNTSPLQTATGGSTTTMTVSGTPWITNQWVGAKVTFTTGANAGLSRIVTSNTNNTLTFPALPNAAVSGDTYAVIPMNVYFENIVVENVEFAIVLRCDNWQINNCHLAYVGPNNSTRRLIGVYRSDGQGLFTNSTYDSGQNGVITGNCRLFCVLSTVGLPIETLGGYLRLGYITPSNSFPVQQFFNSESFLAGATPLTFCVDNCNTKANGSSGETSAFIVWTQTQPTLSQCAQVNLQNNTLSNVHGKGAFALNGASGLGTAGSTTFYASGNTITSTAFLGTFATGITGSVDPNILAQLGYDTTRWSNPNQSITVPAGLNGLFTVDGVPLVDGDRVFVASSDPVQSGIYSATSGNWYRSQDMIAGDDAAGDRFAVTQGTTYANTNWLCTNAVGDGIVGTDGLTFAAA